ncbi:OmpA family protein [Adhaeribacter soli]|uniref:OmpA family protein n=2 Tax=Adhaeribacter soli TaxID=2607655 RepID=A0A5N1ITL6_9BACT|nr:OmpA family protein [Adhaeribacter soli]
MTQKMNLEREKAECDNTLSKLQADKKNLDELYAELTKNNNKLVADSIQTGIILRKTKQLYNDLNSTYEKLNRNHEKLLANSASETSKLSGDLARREAELKALDASLNKSKGQIDQLSTDLKAREEKLKELQRILDEKDKAVANLRTKVNNALLGFNSKDLTVNVKNGKVYVSLSEQLLFKSGSTKVDKKGQDALEKLAKALKDQEDVNVVVEGHTDDVPISKGTAGMKDNWDLSVLRATEITRILTDAGLPGSRVTPSGRAENVPLEAAKTADARQKNRRTEIILTPKLDELFQILEKN